MYLFASVYIESQLPLEDLADLLSERLCGGIPFGGEDDTVRDEVPAVYTLRDFMGLRFVLYGGDGEFGLDLKGGPSHVFDDLESIDVTSHVVRQLNSIEGIKACDRRHAT
jgi:hypothetical protein